jgi:hypothetical protein
VRGGGDGARGGPGCCGWCLRNSRLMSCTVILR